MGKKNREEKQNKVLCEGVELSYDFFEQKESRLKTLLLKGFIVYLISMGSIGFYLSAFNIEYNEQLCHVVIFVMAIICAMLYYRLLFENLGYLLLLLSFVGLIVLFRKYVNSGFYAVVNITVENAAQYFDVDIQKLYQEQIADRRLTVTFMALFIGIVLDIFLNVYISRRMQYVTVACSVMLLNLIPLYLVEEPDLKYAGMLMVGIVMAYVFKSGQHYSPQVNIKRTDNAFIEKGKDRKKKKSELFYVSDIKAMLQAGVTAFVYVLLVIIGVNAFKPQEGFNAGYAGNKYKDITMAAMTTLLIDGWQGFFYRSMDVGGMQSGKLGDVSSVRLDYQTDMIVELTPYTYDRVYIKTFVGEIYNPYANEWTEIHGTNYTLDNVSPDEFLQNEYGISPDEQNVITQWAADYATLNYGEYTALKEAYENNQRFSARGIMNIALVDYGVRSSFEPYYGDVVEGYDSNNSHYSRQYIYYPYFAANPVYTKPQYSPLDLAVPEENIAAISKTIDEAGAFGSDENAIQAIMEYYQENIPYTIRPGRTPNKKDFVNYFLTENKKGYCAHYASAATLMFRYLGIPARYVEGYAIDYAQMAEGELVDNARYGDYYDGYSELGETALISVNVTDADAHAWVEVYTATKGWHIVDVTPSGEMEEVEDFWTLFADYMDDSAGTDDGGGLNLTNIKIPTGFIKGFFYILFGGVMAVVLFFVLRRCTKHIILYVHYKKAGINDKLIYKYSDFRRRYTRKHKAFADRLNYREQIEYIVNAWENNDEKQHGKLQNGEDKTAGLINDYESIIDILERAGFSANDITKPEYEKVLAWLGMCN